MPRAKTTTPMLRTLLLPALAAVFTPTRAGNVQLAGLELPSDAATHRTAVKEIFTTAYATYKDKAWGHDDLAPLSGGFNDPRNGWGATVIDALSTMAVMGLDDLFEEGVEFATKIDFSESKTDDTVSVFETTIRYLGGLISAYELSGKKEHALIDRAQEVADKMTVAWVGDNALPYGHLNFSTNQPIVAGSNIAEAGTLILEWARLSDYTKNDTYKELAEKSFRHIAQWNDTLLPALPGQCINPTTGTWNCKHITWGGGSDSYFEYLIKYARMTNNGDELWVEKWKEAVASTTEHLIKKSTVGNYTFVAELNDSEQTLYRGSHLGCFIGGNWILGGKLINDDSIVQLGLDLVDGCIATYNTSTGIGPEVFAYVSQDGNYTGVAITADDVEYYNDHGFYVYNGYGYYALRPEVIESNFYAWRATGDKKYYDNAVRFIDSLRDATSVGDANAGIGDVRQEAWGESGFFDDTESFFFAEVLKYLYLTFDDPDAWSIDEYIFNTEAHILLAPKPLASYDPADKKTTNSSSSTSSGKSKGQRRRSSSVKIAA